ncbi:MAG: nicotinate (nicotinamide) nucleotide adenylyltransferase [Victivallaceae bacterium]|nr:nicotinate (nicotinamide) nucleotide adenylyltransferase [Victivallaceae bacterium]
MADLKIKTAYFGGSFDPPHAGHIALADAAVAAGLADEVWLAPAWVPPHKHRRLSPFSDRLRMTELACEGHAGLRVCADESEFALAPSYTIDVLAKLEEKYPSRRFLLLIGGDMLATFHQWHRAKELLAKYPVVSYPRPGEPDSAAELRKHWSAEETEKLRSGLLAAVPLFDISSTKIRRGLEKGQNTDNSINTEVFEYIMKSGLYRKKGDKID